MKPNIAIVGRSGSGKSTSLRNLNPETTAVINTERKALPFRNASKFKMNIEIDSLDSFYNALDRAQKSDKVEVIVIDSFTSLVEMIYRESEKRFQGFDIWSYYNKEIGRILSISKNAAKYIIFVAIDGVLESDDGVSERYIVVDGNRWKRRVEKEFVVVLYTDSKFSQEEEKMEYSFLTNTNGRNSAKSPMDMLPYKIDNDISKIINLSEKYYANGN